jgi:hypothetical protein
MYSWHIFLLPVAVVGLVVAHVLLVRRHGIVPPFILDEHKTLAAVATDGAAPPTAEAERSAAAEAADVPDRQSEPAIEAQSPPTGEPEPTG